MMKFIRKTKLYKFFSNLSRQMREIKERLDDINNQVLYLDDKIDRNSSNELQWFGILEDGYIQLKRDIDEVKNTNNLLSERTKQFDCINTELLWLNSNSNSKKILVVGFYGAPNLGDELMLEAILKNLEKYENIEITIMIADNPKYDIRKYGKVNFIHYPKTNMDFHIIAKYFDKIIFGGGALIDDSEWDEDFIGKLSLNNILINLSICAENMKKDVYLVGLSSSTNLNNREYLKKLKYIIDNAKYVSLRDTNSLQTIKNCNINCDKIEVIDDLVYSIDKKIDEKYVNEDVYTIGMVMISYTDFDIMLDILKQTEKFLSNINVKKKKIKLISFYMYLDCDTSKYRDLIKKINNYKDIEIEVSPYANTYDEICKEFCQCNMIVAMRYHASLIALKEQIPTIHIVYDTHNHYSNKMEYLLENYEAKSNSIYISEYSGEVFLGKLNNYKSIKKYSANTDFKKLFEKIIKY